MSDSRGVIYVHLGAKYAVPLAVSLMSLRDWYHDDILLLVDPGPGLESGKAIASDVRFQPIEVMEIASWQPPETKESLYQVKPQVPKLTPFDRTILLDSDTLITGQIVELWPLLDEVVLTNRSNGISAGVKMRLRIFQWMDVDQRRTIRSRRRDYPNPPVNVGVMSWGKGAIEFCDEWRRIAECKQIHSADEMAAQLCYPDFKHRVLDHRFNGNVTHDCGKPDMRIWHGPRSQFWKHMGHGRRLWVPHFQRALAGNFGNVHDLMKHNRLFRFDPNAKADHLPVHAV